MSHFDNLRKTIAALSKDTTNEFKVAKHSAVSANNLLNFLEAAKENSIKIIPEEQNVVFVTQKDNIKYFLTCVNEDEFELTMIDIAKLRKRLSP